VLLLVAVVVGCSAVYLWSRPLVVPPVVEPVVKPVNVTLGVITYDPVITRHFDYIADSTIDEVNAYAAEKGSSIRFNFVSAKPGGIEVALGNVAELRSTQGVKIFLGFDESEAMCASLSYAMSNHVILMGVPLIHHPSSALPGDEMFRVAPNLRQIYGVAVSLVKVMGFDGLLVIHRGSSWADGVETALFDALGQEREAAVRYDVGATEYSATLDLAATQLEGLVGKYGVDHVAVVLVGAGESVTVLEEASGRDGLLAVPWIILNESTNPYNIEAELPDVSKINATNTRLISVKMEPQTDNAVFAELHTGYAATHPPEGDSLGLIDASFHDSIWVACLSILEANTTDAEVLKGVIPGVANGYTGASGRVLLDANGDRMVDYEIYEATFTGSAPTWVKSGRYDAATGQVTLGGE